jgi:enoyl-CoA hydratase/carnithine racemase
VISLATTKIIAERDGAIGWLTLNNPDRHNAISLEMWQGIGDALEAFQHDAQIRVVALKGAGEQAFASGADISEFDQHRANAEQRQRYGEIAARGNRWLGQFSKPLLAMIRGYCIGGGLQVALHADVRIATPQSRFGIPAARLGLGYEYPGVAALARLVGPSNARDILFTARTLDASEALRIGLVNSLVDDAHLLAHVSDYARTIANNAPLTVRAAKAAVNLFEGYSKSDTTEVAALVDACFDSEDYKEGRQAFAQKRKPRFEGH